MNDIFVLDCSLRDGGYINNWKFKKKQIIDILQALKNANIDIVEIGYLNDKKGEEKNTTLFKNINILNEFLLELNFEFKQKVVMINLGDYEISNLPQKNNLIDGIRLAFHKKDKNIALKQAKKILSLGYKLYFQPMITKNYTDKELLELIEEVNKLDIEAFYIVDSFGSMNIKEFQRYIMLADNNLKKTIKLGYHSHNNMQLAFSNAIDLINKNFDRDIIIDSSIYGIGRGAGNLNTELIIDYLNTTKNKNYNILPLLEIIDKYLASLMKEKGWGFSPAQYLSASFNCHPNYVTYLINKNTNHIVTIKEILEKLPKEKRSSFDLDFIENLYKNFILEPKTKIRGDLNFLKDKKILLIASGKSVKDYLNLIKQKKDEGYIFIALNHIPQIESDYYFFSNQKRFDEFKDNIPQNKIVITSNIKTNLDIKVVLDFKQLSNINGKTNTNVAILMINYLRLLGLNKIEIVGLDGYKKDMNNYSYDETAYIIDKDFIEKENNYILEGLLELNKYIKIYILTPSIFKHKLNIRIIGVIPARYKSSRFEGKPLCMIKNIPMIKRTFLQASKSKLLDKLVVATDDKRIEEFCKKENIPVIMTSDKHLTGTDRIAEVATKEFYDLYVNIQGDEPVIDPQSIDEIVREYKKYGDKYIAYNLYKIIEYEKEINSNTIIKVIVNQKDELMYMSRLPIPFSKSEIKPNYKKQVCVYGFTKNALDIFSTYSKTINEQYEDIEILRFIDLGYKVKMKETKVDSIAVDVPEDIKKVEKFLDEKGLN